MNRDASKILSQRAVKAGLLYFAGVFALGFLFGGIRLMLLIPLVGELLAVLIEIPLLLGFAWVLCARAIAKLAIPSRLAERLVMGTTAFILLQLAELMLALVYFGVTPADYVRGFASAAGLAGLAGQLLFALFPLLQRTSYRSS
jgi:hypothetical protein